MNNIKFEIKRAEEFDADHFDVDHLGNEKYLTALGGCSDHGNQYGLGDWQYEFDVLVTNQVGETKLFTIVYQAEERSNGMKNYSGYDIETAGRYGCEPDESDELLQFCDYDAVVLDALYEKAQQAAKAEYNRLIDLLENGEIQPINN